MRKTGWLFEENKLGLRKSLNAHTNLSAVEGLCSTRAWRYSAWWAGSAGGGEGVCEDRLTNTVVTLCVSEPPPLQKR